MAATITSQARKYGRRAGEAKASWVFDGNTTRETYASVLRGLDEGDPAILDQLAEPNLSGEWADDPTPASLAYDLGVDPDDERLDDYCTAWQDAATTAFWRSVERDARRGAR